MQLLPAARKACAVAIGKNIRKTKPFSLTSTSAPLTWKGGGSSLGMCFGEFHFPSVFLMNGKLFQNSAISKGKKEQ